jgi:phosphomannomutase
MSKQTIRFGTDGWRAIIADSFTFENVHRVALASAKMLADTFPGNGIVVGYDRRFMSEDFAKTVASAVQSLGIPVFLSDRPAPTPAYSWAAKLLGAHGALVVTASHNPANYSGIKIKGAFAGSVGQEFTAIVEKLLDEDFTAPPGKTAAITMFDPWEAYLDQLRTKVDLKALRDANLAIFLDAMHGVGAGGLTTLLGGGVEELRDQRDPLFGGNPPEPIARYLTPLFKALRQYTGDRPAIGLVLDGDADRIAAADGAGNYLSCQVLIPLLVDHLARRRGLKGKVVKTISGSDLIAKVARARGLEVEETAIGFKYIADIMLREEVMLGGEESGGIGFSDHMPERDGLLCALYLLEIVAQTGKDLSTLYAELQTELQFTSYYDRKDLKLPDEAFKQKLLGLLEADQITEIAGQSVIEHTAIDGHKFRLPDGRWLLIRFSGTEPLLRLYCEADAPAKVTETLQWAQQWALG